ncbi:unnamed protein product [Hermetia illucens]|uniref:Transposase n=1 Tax=Hermetia illucens TaxID=343691 RepID=A0A7R8UDD7_HERIL|nr:unnamed protein product [Hermetia illucens]
MPRGVKLTDYEKGQISALFKEGISKREIASRIGRSDRVVRNYLNNVDNYGTKKRKGRPRVLSDRDRRSTSKATSNSTNSLRGIRNECKLSVSIPTIWREINRNPNLVREKMRKAPRLQQHHKDARLEFARNNMSRHWDQVIFSDEKKFNLDGPDGFDGYWRDWRKEPRYLSRRNFGGGTVMVWGAICSKGTVRLAFTSARMNSQEYQNVLQDNLLPFINSFEGNEVIFQQDNASVHVSRSTKAWLEANSIATLEWPAYSPDLNPIENVWGWLVRQIYSQDKEYSSRNELKEAIERAWHELTPQMLSKYIHSMPNRIFEVIKKGGNTIDY